MLKVSCRGYEGHLLNLTQDIVTDNIMGQIDSCTYIVEILMCSGERVIIPNVQAWEICVNNNDD